MKRKNQNANAKLSANKSEKKIPTLDLHGYKDDEVFDAIEAFLQQNQNSQKIRIMTGKGKGIVQKRTLEYLKLARYHWQYETLTNGQNNTGVLVVHMT